MIDHIASTSVRGHSHQLSIALDNVGCKTLTLGNNNGTRRGGIADGDGDGVVTWNCDVIHFCDDRGD